MSSTLPTPSREMGEPTPDNSLCRRPATVSIPVSREAFGLEAPGMVRSKLSFRIRVRIRTPRVRAWPKESRSTAKEMCTERTSWARVGSSLKNSAVGSTRDLEKSLLRLFSFLMVLAVSACVSSSATNDEQAVAAVRAVMEAQQAAWNRGDIEGFMDGYERS